MTLEPVFTGRSTMVRSRAALVLALGVGSLWAWWPTLCEMRQRWSSDPRYAHGYLVPIFAVALLWLRRGKLSESADSMSWWGLVILVGGVAFRLVAAYYYFEWFEAVSLLPCLIGIALVLGGWTALRWSWLSIGFLVFMLPLPFRLEVGLAHPLQRIATLVSTYAIQTIGMHAVAEGNVITMDGNVRIGVVEACSGLGMLLTFFAISTGFAILMKRSLVVKGLVILSAMPIAIIANVTRITVTAILHDLVGSRAANLVFHDLAGLIMMPLAIGLLLLELKLLSHLLLTEAEPPRLTPISSVESRQLCDVRSS